MEKCAAKTDSLTIAAVLSDQPFRPTTLAPERET